MKTKTIPFDLELAKKIQAGEVEGVIKTIGGRKARILCSDFHNTNYPIVVAITTDDVSGNEALYCLRLEGKFVREGYDSDIDLVLEVLEVPEDEPQEPQFKPFEQVLVRDSFYKTWYCDYFSHMGEEGRYMCVHASATEFGKDIVPFAGNEHLVGTTDNPKEE